MPTTRPITHLPITYESAAFVRGLRVSLRRPLRLAFMFRSVLSLLILTVLLLVGSAGLSYYREHSALDTRLQEERIKNEQLRTIVQRLSSEHRVADIIVSDQSTVDGVVHTTLVLVEYDRHGDPLPARQFVIEGTIAHIDALVVKFEGRYVQENDPLRGHSIALFTRLYGDKQTPESAARIDKPGEVPLVYRGGSPNVNPFEQELWDNFWKLADDPAYRASMGVRVAQGEGIWRPFDPGFLYTITLESSGGLNITSEKLRGIYKEFIEHQPAVTRKPE
jgi:hypothetical protein